MELKPEVVKKIEILNDKIRSLDYFQILKVNKEATHEEIRINFYRLSKFFHPDRYYNLSDRQLKRKISFIYKQISESYNILKNDKLKKEYINLLDKNRDENLRYNFAEKKKKKEVNGPAKKYFQLGLRAFENRDYKTAKMQLQLALSMEPDNEVIKDTIEEVAAAIKRQYSSK